MKYCPEKDGPALYLECNECKNPMCEAFFCLVVGSRSFHDYEFFKEKLDYLLQNHKKIVIVSGGASGADSLAERYAKEKGYSFRCFPADWSRGGRGGYERNEKMHQWIAHFEKRGVVAFWDGKSRGTTHSFQLAPRYQNPIKIIRVKEEMEEL